MAEVTKGIGCIQAAEVIKYLVGIGNLLINRLLIYDGLKVTFSKFRANKNTNCDPCGSHVRKEQDMSVKVYIHTTHRQFTNGLEVVSLEGSTVGECLNQLIKQFPGMEKALFVNKDKLLKNVEIYLNHASAYPNELVKPVKDGDEIYLIVMLAGG